MSDTLHCSYNASAIIMGAIQGFKSVTFYLADPDPLATNLPKITIKIKSQSGKFINHSFSTPRVLKLWKHDVQTEP